MGLRLHPGVTSPGPCAPATDREVNGQPGRPASLWVVVGEGAEVTPPRRSANCSSMARAARAWSSTRSFFSSPCRSATSWVRACLKKYSRSGSERSFDQVGVLEVGKAGVEGGRRRRHPFDHLVQELASNHRCLPQHLAPIAVEAVDPGGDDATHRRREIGFDQRAGEDETVVTGDQGPGLDQRVDDLLDEERIPVGAFHHEFDQLIGQGVIVQQRRQHLPQV